jgi:hypothetical protein
VGRVRVAGGEVVKALTVRQPWAWAIFHAGKDVENRGWRPHSIEPGDTIAIHVAQKVADNWHEACEDIRLISGADVTGTAGLRGFIIGLVDVVGWSCIRDGALASVWAMPDCFHWHLENPRLIEPVPAKGRLGLWDVPEGLIL